MIPPAPTDLWERVIARIAQLVFEREVALNAPQGVQRLQQGVGQLTEAERAAMHARDMERLAATRRPGTMPSPAPPEAAA